MKPMGVQGLGESHQSRWASSRQKACCLWLEHHPGNERLMGILRPNERNGVDVDIPWNPEVSLSILNPDTTQAGAGSPAAGPQEEEGPGLLVCAKPCPVSRVMLQASTPPSNTPPQQCPEPGTVPGTLQLVPHVVAQCMGLQ